MSHGRRNIAITELDAEIHEQYEAKEKARSSQHSAQLFHPVTPHSLTVRASAAALAKSSE